MYPYFLPVFPEIKITDIKLHFLSVTQYDNNQFMGGGQGAGSGGRGAGGGER